MIGWKGLTSGLKKHHWKEQEKFRTPIYLVFLKFDSQNTEAVMPTHVKQLINSSSTGEKTQTDDSDINFDEKRSVG